MHANASRYPSVPREPLAYRLRRCSYLLPADPSSIGRATVPLPLRRTLNNQSRRGPPPPPRNPCPSVASLSSRMTSYPRDFHSPRNSLTGPGPLRTGPYLLLVIYCDCASACAEVSFQNLSLSFNLSPAITCTIGKNKTLAIYTLSSKKN